MTATKEPRKYKRHTLLRRREAKKNNFNALDLAGKFKMILRQRQPFDSHQLWGQLAREEKLEFIRASYKGVKVEFMWQSRQVLTLNPVKIHTVGFALCVSPKIKAVRYRVELVQLKSKTSDEETLKTIQRYLPTVKAL